ncbi:MAG: DNA primase [Chitinophagales bacterium]|nr:DNA primase [Bacteroidota bacterium]MCB9042689.1 DNA primase [Chitinophagales bacterium]
MPISNEIVQQIVEVAHVEEVISDYVNLKRKGVNLIGLCPFHNEKTPSFIVSPTKNIYKCFGCGKAGGAVQFLMDIDGLSYPEALRALAKRYNITIEEENDEAYDDNKRHQDSLYIINKFAAEFYQHQLLHEAEGMQIGLSYFKERGFLQHSINIFSLGYSPKSGTALLSETQQKGFNESYLTELGLISERNGRQYDFFRERVIFPIQNLSGNVVAFAGRSLSNEKSQPKYINSPENTLYHKTNILYGLYQAKSLIRKTQMCFIVEGYTDVISLHQAGIENVVATCGTSLTEGHAKLLKRFTSTICLLFDGDAAGQNATARGMNILLAEGLQVQFAVLPDKHDPDSFVKAYGNEHFHQFIEKEAKDFSLFYLDKIQNLQQHKPLEAAQLIRELITSIAHIPDSIQRALYMKESARILEVEENMLVVESNKQRQQLLKQAQRAATGSTQEPEAPPTPNIPLGEKKQQSYQSNEQALQFTEREILRLILLYGDKTLENENKTVAQFILEDLQHSGIQFSHQTHQQMLEIIQNALDENQPIDIFYFQKNELPELLKLAVDLLAQPHHISDNWERMHEIYVISPEENYANEMYNLLNRFKLRYLQKAREETIQKLKTAQEEGNQAEIDKQIHFQMHLIKMQVDLSKLLRTDIIK